MATLGEDSLVLFKQAKDLPRPLAQERQYTVERWHGTSPARVGARRIVPASGNVQSIPTRYQTYSYVANENRAFNSTASRFEGPANELPGPGYYKRNSTILSETPIVGTSGSNAFSSKMRRFKSAADNGYTAAPGSYSVGKSDSSNFGKKPVPTAAFARDIITGCYRPDLPGPATYSGDDRSLQKASGVVSAFKSSVVRNDPVDERLKDLPPPGSYELDRDASWLLPGSTTSGAKSAFLASARQPLGSAQSKSMPGPGAYNLMDKMAIGGACGITLQKKVDARTKLTVDQLLLRLPRDWLEPAKVVSRSAKNQNSVTLAPLVVSATKEKRALHAKPSSFQIQGNCVNLL